MNMTENFSPASKVWIYQSSRPLTQEEIHALNSELKTFASQWTAHNQQLQAYAGVLEDRFIVLMADETHTHASGCSIDASVHFIKSIETKYNIALFNRMLMSYRSVNGIQTVSLDEIPALIKANLLSDDTPVYNTLVTTKDEFDRSFVVPLGKSWIKQFTE